jgi:hypothetical protein
MKTINSIKSSGLFITISVFLLGTLTFNSCDLPAALGSKLNLDPPMVTIIEPVFLKNITNTLFIKGIATDRDEIVNLNVTIEKTKKTGESGTPWKKEFFGVRGVWSAANPADILDSTWDVVKQGLVEWSIEIPMASVAEGEYLISAGAVNNVQNAGPLAQQRVVVDHTPPDVTITLPSLEQDSKLDELTDYPLRNAAYFDKLHNRSVIIQYEVTDEFSIAALQFTLTDKDGNVYYKEFVEKAKRSGNFTILADSLYDYTAYELSGGLTKTKLEDRTNLQIISQAWDMAGNVKDPPRSHGYFVWCPPADFPWAEGVGDKYPNTLSTSESKQIYPEQDVYGQAYDNQGVKSVTYSVYGGVALDVLVKTGSQENIPLQEGAAPSQFFNFKFIAPKQDGIYKIVTVTKDIYDNETTDEFSFYVFVPSGNRALFQGFDAIPDTYGIGETITIHLNLDRPVRVNNDATLTLNVRNGSATSALATLVSTSNGTNKLSFTYTPKAGDSAAELHVESINTTSRTQPNGDPLAWPNTFEMIPGQGLESLGAIIISTDSPTLTNTAYIGTTLTLTFSKQPLYKGQGNITLTQQEGTYLAPAVLTKTEYIKFGGDAVLGSYYKLGINGADQSGTPDTSEKYVLDYTYNTNNTSLISALKGKDADKIIIAVVSSAATVSNNTLLINLSDIYGYAPRVKGATYIITYDEGIIKDDQGNNVTALDGTSRTLTVSGVNKPYIRVEKKKESYITSGEILNPTVTFNRTTETLGGRWVRNANFEIQAAKPTTGGTWEQVLPFFIGTRIDDNNREITGYLTSQTGRYIPSTQGQIQGNHVGGNGSFWQNNTNQNTLRFSWWFDNGAGGWTLQPTGTPFWVNPYDNDIILYDNNDSTPGFYVGTHNNPPMWVNIATTGAQTSTSATSPGKGYIHTGGKRFADSVTITAETETVAKNVTAVQPLTVGVKIDCQTPGATVRYSTSSATGNPYGGQFDLAGEIGHPTAPSFSMPTTSTTTLAANASFTLGQAGNLNGYIYGIRAAAQATQNSTTHTEYAYEKAARSVIMFNNIGQANNWSALRTLATNVGRNLQLWIRGGDDLSGSSLTPGFPMSWSDADYKGARLMSGITDGGAWYWVTWEVSTQAYFHFVAGTTSDIAQAENGPQNWGWAKNAWSFQHEEYPLYSGACLVFRRDTVVTKPATDTFEFYNTFSGSR